jgi:hypothetical protein
MNINLFTFESQEIRIKLLNQKSVNFTPVGMHIKLVT